MKFTQPPLINMLPIWGTSSPSADVIKVLSLHCIEIEWREYRNSCLGSMVCLDYLATSISRQRTPCPVPSSSQHNNHHPNAVSNISHFSLRRCRVEVHPSSPESSKTSRRRWEIGGQQEWESQVQSWEGFPHLTWVSLKISCSKKCMPFIMQYCLSISNLI